MNLKGSRESKHDDEDMIDEDYFIEDDEQDLDSYSDLYNGGNRSISQEPESRILKGLSDSSDNDDDDDYSENEDLYLPT